MTITESIAAFYPAADAGKVSYLIEHVKAHVISYTNMSDFPDGDTLLDSFVAGKVIELLRRDERGYTKSVGIESYSETYSDNDELFNPTDQTFLNRYFKYFR